MRRAHLPILAGLALVAACATTTALADAPLRPFDYVSFVEDDHEKDPVEFDRNIIDPDSSLIVIWDEERLRAALLGEAAADVRMEVTEERRLDALRGLVEAFLETQAALIRVKSLGASTLSAEAEEANNEFGTAGLRSLELAEQYRVTLVDAGLRSEADAFRGAMNEAVLEDYAALAQAVKTEIEQLNDRVKRALAGAPKRTVQMRATLVSATATRRLHLDGYDTFGTFDPVETPRFQFELDERARQEVEAAQKLGEVVKQAISGELKRKLEAALETLRDELKQLGQTLKTDVIDGNVNEALRQMRESGDASFGPTINAGETLAGTLNSLQLTTPPFEAETDAQQLLLIYEAVTSQVGGLINQLSALPAQIESFVSDVERIATAVPGAITEDAKAALRQSRDNVKNSQQIKVVIQVYRDVRDSLGLSIEVAQAALEGAELPRAIDESLDTRLDLLISTPGRRYTGDLLILEAVITEGDGDQSRNVARGFRKIRLRQLGLRGEVRGALVFSDPKDALFADQDWEPTPALGYMLHYGKRGGRFWNEVLDPGLGIAMMVLDYQDEDDFELGVAVNVSFFRSLLWVGYGRNIQAESDFFHLGVNPLAVGRLFREGGRGTGALPISP